MEFANPWFLVLLVFLPLIWRTHARRSSLMAIKFPFKGKRVVKKGIPARLLSYLPILLFSLVVTGLVLALARPRIGNEKTLRKSEGLDIFLVVDTSGSMEARDFVVGQYEVDRLTAVKAVMREFIKKRTDDRIGLVVFGSHAFAQAPLTLDHEVLLKFLDDIQIKMAGPETAIGDAIGVTVNRLKGVTAKSKIAILLTDGENSAGEIDPKVAANAAEKLGVKFYTIGAGGGGGQSSFLGFSFRTGGSRIDENMLRYIANTTGGKYFRAKDTKDLVNIYNTIDELEKTTAETQVFRQYDEKYSAFLFPVLWLLFGIQAVSIILGRKLP